MDATLEKLTLRRRQRSLRRELSSRLKDAPARAARRLHLDDLPPFASFAGYVAMGSEIDPTRVMDRLASTGATACLPVAAGRDSPIEFRRWDPRVPLEYDAYGIPAPPRHAEILQPDLVIVPLLAFDRRGGRLGQGAGHYDRALANLGAAKPVFVMGLAYAGQEVDEAPLEPHDERLDAILTEAEFIRVAEAEAKSGIPFLGMRAREG